MKFGLPKIRGLDQLKNYQVSEFIKDNWLKILLMIFALFILMKKDISFNFDLRAAGGQMHSRQSYEPIKTSFSQKENINHSQAMSLPMPSISVDKKKLPPVTKPPKVTEKKTSPPKKKAKDNRANHFFNIAFILNPDVASKKNIDPKIVQEKNDNCYQYVNRYSEIAVAEMKKYGIPASITLAQGLLESDAGGSRLSRKNNNHFGIKCFSKKCGKGHCSNFTDDTHKDFFRKYKNVWQSYRAHSLFLQRKRYAHLKKLGTEDYKGWAKGLREAGYATDKRYAEKLIKIIEVMELQKYDV